MKKILSLILVFAGLFVLGLKSVSAETKTVPFEVDILLDGENQTKQELNGEYGSTYSLDTLPEGYDFKFWVVNGFKKDYPVDHEFLVTENMKLQAVFTKDKHAVLFVDTNGELIETLYVSETDVIVAPVVELSKPGFVLSDVAWLDQNGEALAESVTESLVYTAQYELENNTVFEIIVNEGTILTNQTGSFILNEVVVVDTELEGFTHWEENGKVVSFDKNYAFTVVQDRDIEAKAGGTVQPLVTMTPNLELRDGYETFLGQFFLPEGYELVEYGFLGSEKVEVLTHDSEGVTVIPSNNYNELTKEFVRSFKVEDAFVSLRAYVVAKNESGLVYIYNEVEEIKHALTLGANLTANVTGQIVDGTEVVVTINVPAGKEISAFKVNGVDKLADIVDNTYTFVITEATSVSVTLVDLPITVAEARAKTSGNVFVKGIVTGLIYNKYVVISDEDGTSIYLYYNSVSSFPTNIEIGDMISVGGQRAIYNGLEQISNVTNLKVISSNNDFDTHKTFENLSDLKANDQGRMINLNEYNILDISAISNSSSTTYFNLTVTNGEENVVIRIEGTEAANEWRNKALSIGLEGRINVTAYIAWFNGLQLYATNLESFVEVPLTDEEKIDLAAEYLFNEINGNKYQIGSDIDLISEYKGVSISWLNIDELSVDGIWNGLAGIYTLDLLLEIGELSYNIEVEIELLEQGSQQEALVATLTYGTTKYTDSKSNFSNNLTFSVNDGSTFSAASITAATSYWEKAGDAVRLGSSKNVGTLTVNFSSEIEIKSITIVAKQYDGAVSIKVNSLTAVALTSESASQEVVFNIDASLKSFTISSVKTSKSRALIEAIVIEYVAK